MERRDRTLELYFDGSPNVDPITRLPFEASGVRQRLIEGVVEAINGGQTVFFLEMDLNGLKALNDNYGYVVGNEGIKRFAEKKVRVLEKSEEVSSFYFYRPQAGGDEFKAVIITKKGVEARSLLEAKMREEVEIEVKNKEDEMEKLRLVGSFGLAEMKKDGDETTSFDAGAKLFEEGEREAERLLDEEKRKGVEKSIENLIKEVGAGTAEEILAKLAEVMTNNRRLGETEISGLLRILLVTARAEGKRERR